jgi:general secretion pathway protein G
VEVMIVVVIIGLMAGVITYATTGYLEKAKVRRAKADISTLSGALDAYNGENGRFPDNQQGLKALVPNYIKVLQNDPWGRPYQYVQPGRSAPYDLISYGRDGREGGGGADADVSSNDVDAAGQTGK